MWMCQRSAYFKFIPSTHTHTHTHAHTHTHILIPFEDREPTGPKVDIATETTYCLLALPGPGRGRAIGYVPNALAR